MKKRVKNILNNFKNPKFLRWFLVSVLIILAVGAFYYFQKTTGRVKIDNSQIEATIIPITSSQPEQVKKIYVSEGDQIKKGDPIADAGDETLRSPIDAVVVKKDLIEGSNVSPQSPVAELIDPTQIRVVGTIDENKGLNSLKPGQVVSFTVDAYPGKTFWGILDTTSQTAKQTQLSFSISSERPTQQFEVFVKFNAMSYPQIKDGMSAKMTVFTQTP